MYMSVRHFTLSEKFFKRVFKRILKINEVITCLNHRLKPRLKVSLTNLHWRHVSIALRSIFVHCQLINSPLLGCIYSLDSLPNVYFCVSVFPPFSPTNSLAPAFRFLWLPLYFIVFFDFACRICYFFLTSDVHQPLSQIRISLACSLGVGQVIFLAGIGATENTVSQLSIFVESHLLQF